MRAREANGNGEWRVHIVSERRSGGGRRMSEREEKADRVRIERKRERKVVNGANNRPQGFAKSNTRDPLCRCEREKKQKGEGTDLWGHV